MNRKFIVRQRDLKDCGVCCLASIIKYYNGNIPLETIRLDTKTSEEGTTAYNLINAAKKYGFTASGIKIKKLKNDFSVPAIAHIITEHGFNHFVVIYKIDKKYVHLMDPGKGYKKELISEFEKKWTNIILIFKPFKRIPFYNNKNSLLTLLFNLIASEKKIIKQIVLIDFIITALSIITSHYFQISISILEMNYKKGIIFLIILFLSIYIFKIIFEYLKNKFSIYLSKNIDLKIIPEYIYHLFKLPLNIITTRTGGEILTRIQEINSIKNLFTRILISITLDIFLVIGTGFFLFNINSRLFLILCLIAIIYILVGIITSPIIYRKINENLDKETIFNSNLTEKVNAIESIKNLDYTNNSLDNITDDYLEYMDNTFNYNEFQNKLITIKNAVNNLGTFIITSYGFIEILNANLNTLSLITFTFLIAYFLDPIINMIDLIPEYSLIKLSFIKACETLNIEEEKEGKLERFNNGDIIFKNIEYSYDDYHNVLNKINLKINKNSHTIIKGESGSGKSTICQLLNGNLRDYKGKITINNINLKDYSLKTIRQNILYVSQREQLFNGSIKDNIVLDKKINNIELDKIMEITEVKEILDKKSSRLDTPLYDGGYNLSGGERQRIVLARSLLKKPSILILDESLNEVEQDRQRRILKKIDDYLKNTTILYVSHNQENFFNNMIEMEKAYGQ